MLDEGAACRIQFKVAPLKPQNPFPWPKFHVDKHCQLWFEGTLLILIKDCFLKEPKITSL